MAANCDWATWSVHWRCVYVDLCLRKELEQEVGVEVLMLIKDYAKLVFANTKGRFVFGAQYSLWIDEQNKMHKAGTVSLPVELRYDKFTFDPTPHWEVLSLLPEEMYPLPSTEDIRVHSISANRQKIVVLTTEGIVLYALSEPEK
eukprot:gene10895-3290_t